MNPDGPANPRMTIRKAVSTVNSTVNTRSTVFAVPRA